MIPLPERLAYRARRQSQLLGFFKGKEAIYKLLGMIDVGGGMRCAYTAGIYDYLLDQDVQPFDYCLGVSAGSANMITYLAGQRGRNLRFYLNYAFRKEYMSMHNLLKTGSYVDLDYAYTTLSGPDGEDPADLNTFLASSAQYEAVVTDAFSGQPLYYGKESLAGGDYAVIKASCSVPGVCRPYPVEGRPGFDGGVSDPVPYRRALEQGCDRLVVLLTRPTGFRRPPLQNRQLMERKLRDWPNTIAALERRHIRYNEDVEAVQEMERQGKALLVGPADIEGMSTFRRNRQAVKRLYQMGYAAGPRILAFAREA